MTKQEFAKSLLPAEARPLAVTTLYKTASGYLVITEAAGLFNARPAMKDAPPTDVASAYEHSAEVVANHLVRRMPERVPALALPGVCIEGTTPRERP